MLDHYNKLADKIESLQVEHQNVRKELARTKSDNDKLRTEKIRAKRVTAYVES